MNCPYPFEESQETTSFPGFSPTRPYGESRREPGNEAVTRKSSLKYTWRKERTAPFFLATEYFLMFVRRWCKLNGFVFFLCHTCTHKIQFCLFFLRGGAYSSASPAWGLLTSWLCLKWGVNVWVDCAASFGMGTDAVAVLATAAAVSFFQLMEWPSNHVVLRFPWLRFEMSLNYMALKD